MQAVLFCGVQGAGKSTFYRDRFFTTHVRISLDLLRTRHREQRFFETCLTTRQPLVVDNTNPTRAERRPYLEAARAAGYRAIGYYFQSSIEECKRRNSQRPSEQIVPLAGLLGTYAKLELPSYDEGFDELFYVKGTEMRFDVEEWRR